MNLPIRCLMAATLLAATAAAVAAPSERNLKLTLTVDATQDWRNGLQWGKADSQQRYQLTTRLYSDGRLYADNLIDDDLQKRAKIKSDYYTYQGLLKLKREFKGKLPTAQQVSPEISMESMMGGGNCTPGLNCDDLSPERYAAIAAIQENPPEKLESFMANYDRPGGRWLYFMGYAGCPTQMDLSYKAHFTGEQAFDYAKKSLQPFEMTRVAATQGSDEDKKRLCSHYVITYDTQAKAMYLENAYIPEPHGTSDRTTKRGTKRVEMDMPLPFEVMNWVQALLRKAPVTGSRQEAVPITLPLDGNSTVLGSFNGTAKVALAWDFQ